MLCLISAKMTYYKMENLVEFVDLIDFKYFKVTNKLVTYQGLVHSIYTLLQLSTNYKCLF